MGERGAVWRVGWRTAMATTLALSACTGPAAPPVDTEPVTTEPVPEPEPVSEPLPAPPAPLVAPNGKSMQPCAEAPAGMACVPGGPFERGSERPHTCPQGEIAWIPKDQPNYAGVDKVWVSTLYMDVTEVTYSAYQACVKAGKCKPAGPTYDDYDRPDQPMVGANYYKAQDYCRAVGKHLPTEAEWEKAARGPDGDLYPWGNEPASCERAVLMDERGRSCGVAKQGRKGGPEKGRTWEVARIAPFRYGLYDMIGNAEEWTADWSSRDYDKCGADCEGVDPKGPCGGGDADCGDNDRKVVRGGSWYWGPECATSVNRRPHFGANKPFHHFGFRCAASFDEAVAIVAADRAAIDLVWPQDEADVRGFDEALTGVALAPESSEAFVAAASDWLGKASPGACADEVQRVRGGGDARKLLSSCPTTCTVDAAALDTAIGAKNPAAAVLAACDRQGIDRAWSGGPVRFRKWMSWSDYLLSRTLIELARDRLGQPTTVATKALSDRLEGLRVAVARDLARRHQQAIRAKPDDTDADREAAAQQVEALLHGPIAPPPSK